MANGARLEIFAFEEIDRWEGVWRMMKGMMVLQAAKAAESALTENASLQDNRILLVWVGFLAIFAILLLVMSLSDRKRNG